MTEVKRWTDRENDCLVITPIIDFLSSNFKTWIIWKFYRGILFPYFYNLSVVFIVLLKPQTTHVSLFQLLSLRKIHGSCKQKEYF